MDATQNQRLMQEAIARGDRPTHRRHGHTCAKCGHQWWHDPDACRGDGATYESCTDAHVCSKCDAVQREVDLSICDKDPEHVPASCALRDPPLGAVPRPGASPDAPIGAASETAQWAALSEMHGPGGWCRLGSDEVVRGDRRLDRVRCVLPGGEQAVTYFARPAADPQDPEVGAARAPLPSAVASIKRAPDFQDTHEYLVTMVDGAVYRIFRDTSQFSHALWHDADAKPSDTLGLGWTQAEALEALARRHPVDPPVGWAWGTNGSPVVADSPVTGIGDEFVKVRAQAVAGKVLPDVSDDDLTRWIDDLYGRGFLVFPADATPPGGWSLMSPSQIVGIPTSSREGAWVHIVQHSPIARFYHRSDALLAGTPLPPEGQPLDPQPRAPRDPSEPETLGGGKATWDPSSQRWLSTPHGKAIRGAHHRGRGPAPHADSPGAAAPPAGPPKSSVLQVFGSVAQGIGGLAGALGGGGSGAAAGGAAGAVGGVVGAVSGAIGGLGDLGLGAAGGDYQWVADRAVTVQPVVDGDDSGDEFWELDPGYARRLFHAMTNQERVNPRLPLDMVGTTRSGASGWLDASLRPLFKKIGAEPDGPRSWGIVSHDGAHFLVRLAHHGWTTDRAGNKVAGSFAGLEAYRLPADLAARVDPQASDVKVGAVGGYDPVSRVEFLAPGGYRVRATGDVLRRAGSPAPMSFDDSVAAARTLGAVPPTRALSAAALAAARAAGTAVVMPVVQSPDPKKPGAHPTGTALGDQQVAAYAAAYPPPLPAGSTALRYGGHKDMVLDPAAQPVAGPDGKQRSELRPDGPGSMVLYGGLKDGGGLWQAGVKSDHDRRWRDYSQPQQFFFRDAVGPSGEPVDLLDVVAAGGPLGGPLPGWLVARLGGPGGPPAEAPLAGPPGPPAGAGPGPEEPGWLARAAAAVRGLWA